MLGSRAHVMRTRRLHARLRVFVPAYQWNGYNDINMFVDDATLKNARHFAEVAIHFRTRAVLYTDYPGIRKSRIS